MVTSVKSTTERAYAIHKSSAVKQLDPNHEKKTQKYIATMKFLHDNGYVNIGGTYDFQIQKTAHFVEIEQAKNYSKTAKLGSTMKD